MEVFDFLTLFTESLSLESTEKTVFALVLARFVESLSLESLESTVMVDFDLFLPCFDESRLLTDIVRLAFLAVHFVTSASDTLCNFIFGHFAICAKFIDMGCLGLTTSFFFGTTSTFGLLEAKGVTFALTVLGKKYRTFIEL